MIHVIIAIIGLLRESSSLCFVGFLNKNPKKIKQLTRLITFHTGVVKSSPNAKNANIPDSSGDVFVYQYCIF